MQRVAIIGSCGAGKSTLSEALGEKLNLPVIHLDAHYWRSGWQETKRERWQEIQQELVKADKQIIMLQNPHQVLNLLKQTNAPMQ